MIGVQVTQTLLAYMFYKQRTEQRPISKCSVPIRNDLAVEECESSYLQVLEHFMALMIVTDNSTFSV